MLYCVSLYWYVVWFRQLYLSAFKLLQKWELIDNYNSTIVLYRFVQHKIHNIIVRFLLAASWLTGDLIKPHCTLTYVGRLYLFIDDSVTDILQNAGHAFCSIFGHTVIYKQRQSTNTSYCKISVNEAL